MKYSIAFVDLTAAELQKIMAVMNGKGKGKVEEQEEDDDTDTETDDDDEPVKAKSAKGGKKAKPADDDDDDASDDDDDGPTLETVIKAFKAYVKENDRKAANTILKKFKVTSVSELDEKDYPKVLKLLA